MAAGAVLVVVGAAVAHRESAQAATTPAATGCTVQLASPLFVALGSPPAGVVIDAACQYAYLTNPVQNRIEVFSLGTLTLEEPIQVGAQPVGLALRGANSLYVANSGGNNLSVVDLARRIEVRKIPVPTQAYSNDRPFSIAFAANGRAFFTTTFNGGGYGGRIMQLDLATEQATQRTDASYSGLTTERAFIRPNHDRTTLAFADGNGVFVYSAGSNSFSPIRSLSGYARDVGVDLSGSILLTAPGGYVLDAGLNQIGTVAGGAGSVGVAVDPGGVLAYRSMASKVEILNLSTFLVTGEVALGDSVAGVLPYYAVPGTMDLSADGKVLIVATNTGFTVVPTPVAQSAQQSAERDTQGRR